MPFVIHDIEYRMYIQDSSVMAVFLLTVIKYKITLLLPHSSTNRLHRETDF